MKVLFLDVDGVLNHKLFYDNFDNIQLVHNNYPYTEFDPTSISLLNKILSETNAKLVISSSWKVEENLNDILKEVGVKFDIYDITPMLWGCQQLIKNIFKNIYLCLKKYKLLDNSY